MKCQSSSSIVSISLTISVVLAACGSPDQLDLTKDQARLAQRLAEPQQFDYCDYYGWYGDGECDSFCQVQDSDCFGTRGNSSTRIPECRYVGTRTEGWYWADTNELIKYETCNQMSEPSCEAISSRSEGWYTGDVLIAWDSCHQVVRISLWGEACGPSIGYSCHDNLYCHGLPIGQHLLGGSGVCRHLGFCKTIADCANPDNTWSETTCQEFVSCEAESCVCSG